MKKSLIITPVAWLFSKVLAFKKATQMRKLKKKALSYRPDDI